MNRKILAIKKKLSKIPLLIASNVFISGLVVFFVAFILVGILFYRHIVGAEKEEGPAPGPQFQINQGDYQKFLDFLQGQEAVFSQPKCENCRDIFRNPIVSSKSLKD